MSPKVRAVDRAVIRIKIQTLAQQGMRNKITANKLHISRNNVTLWANRSKGDIQNSHRVGRPSILNTNMKKKYAG